jgi:quercetin dioxygenase-like cupin family protein
MKIVRSMFAHAVLVILFVASPLAWSQPAAQPPVSREALLREAIEAAPGQDISVSKLTVPPGYAATSHSHPGETFVYVLEGRILNQIGDQEPKIYEAGQFFFEHANATHAQLENLDREKSATVLIYGIRPVGAN